jgi:hypothetical protein
MAQIEQQLGKPLPLTTLFQNATIEQLALILRQQPKALPLVAIQAHDEKLLLFYVNPTGGHIWN